MSLIRTAGSLEMWGIILVSIKRESETNTARHMNSNHRSEDILHNVGNAYRSRGEVFGIQERFAMVSFFRDRFPTVNVYTLETLDAAMAVVLRKDPSPKETVCSRSRFSNAISRTFLHDSDPTVRCSSDPISG